MPNLGSWIGSGPVASRRALAVSGAAVVLGLVVVGCGDPQGASRGTERVDGVTVFTFAVEPGTPIAGPLIMRGSFEIEDGCVVMHSQDFVANPIFIPDGRLSADHSSMTVGGSTFALDGTTTSTFGGQTLDAEQARRLGYAATGVCRADRFVFVYGEGA